MFIVIDLINNIKLLIDFSFICFSLFISLDRLKTKFGRNLHRNRRLNMMLTHELARNIEHSYGGRKLMYGEYLPNIPGSSAVVSSNCAQ